MAMNSLTDPSKKTSINSLLNPQDASAGFPTQLPNLPASVGHNQGQHHDQHAVAVYPSSFSNGASFNLRAANWDVANDAAKRKSDNGASAHQHYHHPPINSPQVYSEHPQARIIRPRMDDANAYVVQAQSWPQPEVHYSEGPILAPMYSDERTALSGDYHPHNTFNQAYPDQMPPSASSQTWQNAERVSVRVAARSTAHDPMHQDARFAPYYPGPYNVPYPQPAHPPAQQLPPQSQNQQQAVAPEKRSLAETDEAPAPKPKRAKTKPKTGVDGATGPSKRGYNAKKRSEAAQIAAQNAQLMPTVSYTQVPSEKGKEKAANGRMQIVSSDGAQAGAEASGPLHPELQFARCMSNRYKSEQFPRCVSCTRRWAGDTCRFQGIRFFLKDQQRNIVGISFVESQKADTPTMNFPSRWNIPLEPAHTRRTKTTIARALLPTLREELTHLGLPEIIRRPRESEVRATCDTCMTSIFSSSWMCRLCGREACAECFEQVKDLTVDRPGAGQAEIVALQARREKHAHSNPFFLSCTRRNEHQAKDFSPMSRFCRAELSLAIENMETLLKEVEGTVTEAGVPISDKLGGDIPDLSNHSTTTKTESSGVETPPDAPAPAEPALKPASPALASLAVPEAYVPPGAPDIPYHIIRRFKDSELTDDIFRPIWAKGEPLLVTDVLHKFNIKWTPEYFVEKYDTQNCLILECQTDVNKRVTVGEFFNWFGHYEGRTECWKLKDWPPSTDFKTAFPELYEDFSRAVPVPNYVRRDGVLNIASHFPSNTIGPDLGPKMYNAMASTQSPGSKGSTRLHMDMADALNIMTYAAPAPDGAPGCAAWDLFRAEDSDRIRAFLRKKFKGMFQHDPIHSQHFYLDETLRRELLDDCGVMSYRVYQRPGEAVFIPAGCAHQVSNMADCVKVAVDFVSPENIERCEKLTREFREQNQSMVWKEDVLQLRTMMWFAWLSCCQQDGAKER